MSETSLKTITDRAGTGSPNFSQGVKISGADSGLLAPTRTEGDTQPDADASSNGDTFYDTVNDTYDILIEDAWVRVIGEGGALAVVNWTVDVSNATYDNVSFSTASQTNSTRNVVFNTDGTKMYVGCSGTDSIFQYSLSTGFDIATASYDSKSFNFSTQDAVPLAVAFDTDGTKMYMSGASNDSIFQYSLSTAFDVSTASYDSVSLSLVGIESAPSGLTFNPEGTKLYFLGSGTDTVREYNLSTAFDLSTASYNSVSLSLVGIESTPSGLTFNPEGTKLYIVGSGGDRVRQFSLSTAFDLSTASLDNLFLSVSSQDLNPRGVTFNNDGTKMYISGDSSDAIYQYSTGL